MNISRRTLIGSDGSLLGIGDKVGVLEGFGRVSNETRRVFDLWLHGGGPDGLPRLSDLALDEVADLLPSILIVDVLEATHDYRYRQVGVREAEVRGEDPTGRTVRQCHQGEILSFVLENYDRVVASGDGLLDLSVDIDGSRRFIAAEVLFLPLSDVGVAVTEILVYSHYMDTKDSQAEQ
ncbi:MAG TPA: hypothetical protein VFG64_05160 [Dongiaceae bacterium]|nr:hypothetical protein [Dongiaceae bacterium]